MTKVLHVYPLDDAIEHVLHADECVCGPTLVPVSSDDGTVAWMYTHHALLDDDDESDRGTSR